VLSQDKFVDYLDGIIEEGERETRAEYRQKLGELIGLYVPLAERDDPWREYMESYLDGMMKKLDGEMLEDAEE